MNLVGKIFVVLIFVMSLVFMSFAIAVYATHTNWREMVERPAADAGAGRPLGIRIQLQQSRANNAQLKTQLETLQTTLATETKAKDDEIAKLRTELANLTRERDDFERRQAQLDQDRREAVAAMQAAQDTLKTLRTEVDDLRDSVRTAQSDRDSYFRRLVDQTDQLQQSAGELKRLKSRTVQLTEQIARMQNVLAANDLDEFEDVSGVPPRLDGIVLATRPRGYVEISVGSDDGLRTGHKLQVFRLGPGGSKFLGTIEVIETRSDKAVAKVIPETRQGSIEKEDRVATRLR